jgi:hypothetical protein
MDLRPPTAKSESTSSRIAKDLALHRDTRHHTAIIVVVIVHFRQKPAQGRQSIYSRDTRPHKIEKNF